MPSPLASFTNILGHDSRIVRRAGRLFIELRQENFGGEAWVIYGTEEGYDATPDGLSLATKEMLEGALQYVVQDLAEILTPADLA